MATALGACFSKYIKTLPPLPCGHHAGSPPPFPFPAAHASSAHHLPPRCQRIHFPMQFHPNKSPSAGFPAPRHSWSWSWQILDVMVQAASELAGWARPSADDGGGGGIGSGVGPGGEHPSSSGGSYPSALMQEAKGASPQGSVRRQQQGPSSTRVATAAAAAATVAPADSTKNPKSDGATAVSSSRRAGEMSGTAGGATRRWGYRRGPREQLRRNLFGRFAPVFFYPLAQVRLYALAR